MLFFLNILEKSCISGTGIPSLAFPMGTAGKPEAFFPGFGWNSGNKWSRKVRLGLMFYNGDCPLQITNTRFRSLGAVAKTVFGLVVTFSLSTATRAQTYYYYPASVPAAPSVTPMRTVTPTGYVWGNQGVQYTYSPQYYQPAYTTQATQTYYAPQYYQTTYQTQAVQPVYAAQPTQPAVQQTAQSAPVAAASGDPYGFVGWLNATRASYGLPAVGYDQNLTNWAAMNNDQQAARGMGHFVMGPARRQNSAMGAFANIGAMWMNSPAHRAALLDPTITAIGIAGAGAYWTFNAY
jgi:uncharacterized protein YkwD